MRLFLALAFVASYVVIHAQAPADNPSFEVASVKPNTWGALTGKSPSPEGDRVTAYNGSGCCFLSRSRTTSVPTVLVVDRTGQSPRSPSVVAKAGQPLTGNTWQVASPQPARRAVQASGSYRDARGAGLRARQESTRSMARPESTLRSARLRGHAGGHITDASTPNPCGMHSLGHRARARHDEPAGRSGITMLLGAIARDLRRDVVDGGGITGLFDIYLTWTPQTLVGRPADRASPPSTMMGADIFTALQGAAWVESRTGNRARAPNMPSVEIDHVERPTPD